MKVFDSLKSMKSSLNVLHWMGPKLITRKRDSNKIWYDWPSRLATCTLSNGRVETQWAQEPLKKNKSEKHREILWGIMSKECLSYVKIQNGRVEVKHIVVMKYRVQIQVYWVRFLSLVVNALQSTIRDRELTPLWQHK